MPDSRYKEQLAPNEVVKDGCHPDEAKGPKDHCHKRTRARAMMYPVEDLPDPGMNTWRLWSLLTNAIIELPESGIPHLVELLKPIQQLPEADLTDNHAPAQGTLWEELSNFGHMWSDQYKQSCRRDRLTKLDSPKRERLPREHIMVVEMKARMFSLQDEKANSY